MSTLDPTTNATAGTAPLALPDTPSSRRRADVAPSEVPSWGMLLVTLGSAAVMVAAAAFAIAGLTWVALPFAVAAVAIFCGIFIPDALGRRWDRAAADEVA